MRLFTVICLFCIAIQAQAWPWTGKISKKEPKKPEAPVEETSVIFDIPSLEEEAFPPKGDSGISAGKTKLTAIELRANENIVKNETVYNDTETASAQKINQSIAGKGQANADKLVAFFLSENKAANKNYIEELVHYYITESEIEGINYEIAFAQMCLETGFLRFGGLVSAEMNNFCGLGSTGPGVPGASFPSPQLGIRAHIQHLQAYATNLPLQSELVDPRYHFVRRGSAPVVKNLAGSWAADPNYAEKIETILGRIYRFEEPAGN
jgi:hypothetical protein